MVELLVTVLVLVTVLGALGYALANSYNRSRERRGI